MAVIVILGVLAVVELVLLALFEPLRPWYIARDTWHWIITGEMKEHSWTFKNIKDWDTK